MHARPLILGVSLVALGAATLFGNRPQAESRATLQPRPAAVPHARVSLVADVKSFVPGKPFTVAVAFEIDPSWHVYYMEPGDSGMPPEVKWDLPEGLTAGPLQFPKPEVLKTAAGVNFVYHDKVALLVEMTPGVDFKIGRAVEIKAAVAWLECDADQCLPGNGTAATSLTAEERISPNAVEPFAAWRILVDAAASFDPAAHK